MFGIPYCSVFMLSAVCIAPIKHETMHSLLERSLVMFWPLKNVAGLWYFNFLNIFKYPFQIRKNSLKQKIHIATASHWNWNQTILGLCSLGLYSFENLESVMWKFHEIPWFSARKSFPEKFLNISQLSKDSQNVLKFKKKCQKIELEKDPQKLSTA